ncbi:flagellar biosynthesis/type III secretory pathway protein FliH [Bradyrhizobium diazoefficiens]|uniref:hypothetical protein n=1 Tax=Bradyrhizobium diazoefficiens TaxID=1355477 RepID=UPI00351873DC
MIGAKGFRAREAAANYKRRDRRLVSDEVRAARAAQLPGVSYHASEEVTDDVAAKAAAEAAAKEAAEAAEKAAAEAAEKEAAEQAAAETTEQAGDDAGEQAGEETADKPAKSKKKK